MSEFRIKLVLILSMSTLFIALYLFKESSFFHKKEELIEFHQALPEFIIFEKATADASCDIYIADTLGTIQGYQCQTQEHV